MVLGSSESREQREARWARQAAWEAQEAKRPKTAEEKAILYCREKNNGLTWVGGLVMVLGALVAATSMMGMQPNYTVAMYAGIAAGIGFLMLMIDLYLFVQCKNNQKKLLTDDPVSEVSPTPDALPTSENETNVQPEPTDGNGSSGDQGPELDKPDI